MKYHIKQLMPSDILLTLGTDDGSLSPKRATKTLMKDFKWSAEIEFYIYFIRKAQNSY